MNLRNRRSTTGHPILLDCYTHTHTHSLWICNLEDSQKSTRQAFLNFEIFREYKALKDFGQIDYVQDRADTRSNRLGILLR